MARPAVVWVNGLSLSDDERDRLLEIEALTAAADPQFARRLDLDAAVGRRHRARWACWILLVVSTYVRSPGSAPRRAGSRSVRCSP